MTGGTLIVTKKISRHQDFVCKFEALGFPDVSITSLDKDALYFLIDELKPSLILMDAMFYSAGTPYMTRLLIKNKRFKHFKDLNIAVFAVDEYPADLGMMFIINGAKSYVDINDGERQFEKGLISVRDGNSYVSPSAQKRIELRDILPAPTRILTESHKIVLLLTCCGFDRKEISDSLGISKKTVDNHRSEIYKSLSSDNPYELIRIADKIKLFTAKDLIFFGKNFEAKPKVKKKAA